MTKIQARKEKTLEFCSFSHGSRAVTQLEAMSEQEDWKVFEKAQGLSEASKLILSEKEASKLMAAKCRW